MMRRSRGAAAGAVLLVLGLFLAMPGVVLAGDTDDQSTHGAAYLRMGAGARALGMGGAGVAAGQDAAAGYYNPAALGYAWGSQITATHALGMEVDRRMTSFALSHRLDWGTVGATFVTAGMSDIPGYDESQNPTGEFNYGENAFMFHGAYIADYFTLGGTFKILHEGVGDAEVEGDDSATGFGFDLGAVTELTDWVRLGFAWRDIASTIGEGDANEVPMNLRGGIAFKPLDWVTFAADAAKTLDEEGMEFYTGVEGAFPVTEDFGAALRFGLRDGQITAGLGMSFRMVAFNYAYLEEKEDFLDQSHRIGVTMKFGEEECPFEAAPRSMTVKKMKDRDGDGIADSQDACPTAAEDFDGYEDTDGCPDEDNDGDGILDVNDDCPTRAEDFDGYQDRDGCPDVDNDGDGILDADDKCPSAAETFNRFEDTDGCPDEVPVEFPLAHITFRTGSAVISGADPIPVLEEVASRMKAHPDMRVSVIGHTDSVGGEDYNQNLSKARAESVKAYLVGLGVRADRLVTEGRGESEPIDSNDTNVGRARNRRIEFKVAN